MYDSCLCYLNDDDSARINRLTIVRNEDTNGESFKQNVSLYTMECYVIIYNIAHNVYIYLHFALPNESMHYIR